MFGIFDLLDNILPCSDTSKHDIQRLEYLSACKVKEDETNITKIFPQIPASIYELLLQSVIYNYYRKFINHKNISMERYSSGINISFPKTLEILILNSQVCMYQCH